MKSHFHRLLSAGLATSIMAFPALTFATNGMYLIGFGAESRGMGGAAYGLSEDSLIAAVNPAGISNIDADTMQFDAGLMIFHPDRAAYCCNAPDGETSGSTLYAIPNMGMVYKFNRKLSFGMAFVGAGGGGTRYNYNFFGGDGTLGVTLQQAIMSPTVSYKIDKNQSVGFSPLIGIQMFRGYGLQPFVQFSSDPANVTNNGNEYSYGAGARLGYQGQFFDKRFTVGAVYSSRIYMTKFDKYSGLFAEHGDLDIPENYGIGIAIRPFKKWTLALDWQHYSYSDVAAIGNRSLPISAAPNDPHNLGRDNGPGFGWKDMDVYKIGLQFDWTPKWTFRTGYNYGKSPIRAKDGTGEMEFNVLAPATVEQHLTGGVTYKWDKNMEFSFAAMHAFKNKQSAFVPQGTGLPFENQEISAEMVQNAWELSFAYKL